MSSAAALGNRALQSIIPRLTLRSESCDHELETGIGWPWQLLVFMVCFALLCRTWHYLVPGSVHVGFGHCCTRGTAISRLSRD